MAGLFGALNTSTSGLRAQQVALQTTSHNLANVNTNGYSRQRVTMEANLPQSYAGIGQIGTGVLLNGVIRVTDDFVTMQLQNEQASLTRYQQESDIIGQLEAIYNEPSPTGIANRLSELFVSWSSLASYPESISSKTMVIRQTETFLNTVNYAADRMEELADESLSLINKDILDFNHTILQLKGLNDQIFNARIKGEMPNDLMDSRDQLVGQLKNIAGVKADTDDKYGRAFISLDGQEIVTAKEVKELHIVEAPDGSQSYHIAAKNEAAQESNQVEIASGSMKGLIQARGVVLEKQAGLADFMTNLTSAVNDIYSEGGSPNAGFFISSNGSFEINQALLDDPSQLITGSAVDNSVSGDGSRAKAIADLQQTSTLFDQYNTMVTNMGIVKQQADNMVVNQTDLTALLEQRQASISGVDINEEVVNMIQFQSAFQANARVITTLSEMLDTLINRTGV